MLRFLAARGTSGVSVPRQRRGPLPAAAAPCCVRRVPGRPALHALALLTAWRIRSPRVPFPSSGGRTTV